MTPNEAINIVAGMRIFVNSRQIVKQPEGRDLFDEAVYCLRQAIAAPAEVLDAMVEQSHDYPLQQHSAAP